MGDTNIALKGMLIGIAVVALPVAGFVGVRQLKEDARLAALAANPPPSADRPCPVCPVCPATAAVMPTQAVAPPLAVVTASTAPSASPSSLPGGGTLIVECAPACSGIVVNGKEMGPSPLSGMSLPPGKHKIFAKFDSGSPRVADVVIAAGQTVRVSMAPAGPRDHQPSGSGEGCNPPYWENEDGSRIMKPACGGRLGSEPFRSLARGSSLASSRRGACGCRVARGGGPRRTSRGGALKRRPRHPRLFSLRNAIEPGGCGGAAPERPPALSLRNAIEPGGCRGGGA